MTTAQQVTGSDGRMYMNHHEAKALSGNDLFGERMDLTAKSEPQKIDIMPLGVLMGIEQGTYYIVAYALHEHGVSLDEDITIKHYKHMRKYISDDYEAYQSGKMYKLTKRTKGEV